MAPVTFEKRKEREPKNPALKREPSTAAKKAATANRPTFNSFPTEQGPIKHDNLNKQTETMAKTLAETFQKPSFNWKSAAASAVAVLGVAAGVGALLVAKRSAGNKRGTARNSTKKSKTSVKSQN